MYSSSSANLSVAASSGFFEFTLAIQLNDSLALLKSPLDTKNRGLSGNSRESTDATDTFIRKK